MGGPKDQSSSNALSLKIKDVFMLIFQHLSTPEIAYVQNVRFNHLFVHISFLLMNLATFHQGFDVNKPFSLNVDFGYYLSSLLYSVSLL